MKKLLFIAFFLLSVGKLNAQSFEEEQIYALKIDAQQTVQNSIVEKIAEGQKTKAAELKLELAFTKDISLKKKSATKFLVSIKVELQDQKSQATYRGFNIDEDLLPSSMNFTLQAGKAKKTLKSFEKVSKGNDHIYRVEFTSEIDDLFSELDFTIGKLKLNYQSVDKERIFKSLNLIDDYYSKSSEIKEYSNLLAKIDFADPEQIQSNKEKINELEVLLSHFEKFPQKLDLEMNDPLGFKVLYEKHKKNHQLFLTAYQDALSQIHALYYQKGMVHQRKGWASSAKANFESSLIHKANYPPALQQLARIYYLEGDFEKAEKSLDLLWEHTAKDDAERKSGGALFEDLYYFHTKKASKAATKLDFELALEEYQKAESICKKGVLEGDCKTELGGKLKKVRADQFEYTIAVARDQVYSKGFRKAKKALEIALTLIADNPVEFIDQSESTLKIFEELYLLAIDDAKEHNESKTFYASVESLSFAELLKEKYPDFNYKKGNIKEVYSQAYDGNYKQRIKEAVQMQEAGELLASRNLFIGALGEENLRKEWVKEPQTGEIKGNLKILYGEFVKRATQYNTAQKYKEAVDDLRIAFSLGNQYQFRGQQEVIAKEFFNSYFGLAQKGAAKKTFYVAMDYLEVANAQLEDERFAEKEQLIEKSSKYRTELLTTWSKLKIGAAQSKLDANQKNKARALLQEVKDLLSDFKFTLDKESRKKYSSLKNAVKR